MRRSRIIGLSLMAALLAFCLSGCANGEKYVPELSTPTVSKPTIGEDGVLRVGVNTSKSPLAGMGTDKIIGIDVDIAAAMADDLGLELSIVDVSSSAADAIADDEVDLVLGIDSSEGETQFWTSSTYLPTGVALFALASSNEGAPDPESEPKIAAQVSSKSAWAVTNTFGEESLYSEADLSTAFEDLSLGEVQYVASDAIIGLYAANRQGIDVNIVALLETPTGYCAGVSPDNDDLQDVVKAQLNKLTLNGTIDVIEMKWLGKALGLDKVEVIEPPKHTVTAHDEAGDEDDPTGEISAEGAEGAEDEGGNTSNTSGTSNSSSNSTT